jgi:alginate O-acetyltransferase complex protein AlgI
MLFSSNIFIFGFLPLFLAAYYMTPSRWRSLTIVAGSWVFYGWWRLDFLLLYALVTVWSYLFGHLIHSAQTQSEAKRNCIIGVVGSLSVLLYFKYWNFFAASIIDALGIVNQPDMLLINVLLPIGISFFVFESISYLVDIYRKDASPARNFIDFAAFLALYPHLIAGPVMRYKDLSEQITSRSHSIEKFAEGCVWFMGGLCKKVLIADSVAGLADRLFLAPDPTLYEAWLGAIAYSVQLYFDFCGYSEMAVGLGLMIGFRLIKNFEHPYVSRSITEFWQRWHISLSTWLRDYLYIVLGGNRHGKVRTYFNLFLTMVLGGLWHGANWTFVLWGAWHGAILSIERAIGSKGRKTPWPRLIALPLTLLFIVVGWVIFRSPDVHSAFAFYSGMLGSNGTGIRPEIAWQITSMELAFLMCGILFIAVEPNLRSISRHILDGTRSAAWFATGSASLSVLYVVAVLKMAADSYSPFLYFQF